MIPVSDDKYIQPIKRGVSQSELIEPLGAQELEEMNEKLAAVCFERNLAQIDAHRYREALLKIVSVADNDVLLCEPTVFDIAREALTGRL